MSKTKVHVYKKGNMNMSACGSPYNDCFITPYCRKVITCTKCKKTQEYKELPK